MLQKQLLKYRGEWNYETPDGSTVTLTEDRTPKDVETRVKVEHDSVSGEMDEVLRLTDPEDVPKGWKKTSQLISWRFTLKNEQGQLLYNGRIEEYFVLNTTTRKKYTIITWEVIYVGPASRERSFNASGMERNSANALETMMRVAGDDLKRRST